MVSYKQLMVYIAGVVLIASCAAPAKKEQTPQADKAEKQAKSQIKPDVKRKYDAALAAMKAGKTRQARQILSELVNTHPELSGPQTNLGILYYRNNEIELAEKAFMSAIKVNPNSAVSYNHLGIINRNKGKFKEAKQLYEKALNINPDYAYAHLNLGILLDLYIGDLQNALAHYKHYQDLSSEEDKEVRNWIVEIERRIKAKR